VSRRLTLVLRQRLSKREGSILKGQSRVRDGCLWEFCRGSCVSEPLRCGLGIVSFEHRAVAKRSGFGRLGGLGAPFSSGGSSKTLHCITTSPEGVLHVQ